MRLIQVFIAIFWSCFLTTLSSAQSLPSPEDSTWRYYQWMDTAGKVESKALVFNTADSHGDNDRGPWNLATKKTEIFTLNSSEIGMVYNSTYPSTFNTGGIWEGKGFTGWAKTSATAEWNWFSLRLGVESWASQNSSFPLGPSGLSNQPLAALDGAYIDTPQQFGSSSFYRLGLENSELKAQWGPGVLSFSNQNMTFGPSVFNPLLLSSNAEGFPHIRLGLNPLDTIVGKVELQLLYGKLTTSDYWNPAVSDSDRFFGALFMGYQPSFFKELTLGAGRTIISNWDQNNWQPGLALFGTDASNTSNTLGTGNSHQHISLTYRLKFPSVGFETYGEWGKNDFSSPVDLYWINPDHMQAYTLGLKKTFDLPYQGILGIGAELTELSQSKESLINTNGYGLGGDFYSGWASGFAAGYTNQGMVLGASIGNGSEAQYLYADVYYPQWHLGLELRRWADDVSALYLPPLGVREHDNDVEISATIKADYAWEDWLFSASLSQDSEWNRYQVAGNNATNYGIEVRSTYRW